MSTTIFTARRIITMNPSNPDATSVAVRDGRILAVGPLEEVQRWGGDDATIDQSFADKVLLPGFIEVHSHAMAGGMWTLPYVGYFDRADPNGQVWTGCTSFEEVIERLDAHRQMEVDGVDDAEVLVAWGLDPIYFGGDRMLARHLDRVSLTDRSSFITPAPTSRRATRHC